MIGRVIVVGIDEVIAMLESVEEGLASNEIVRAAGERWLKNTFIPQAQRNAPVDTGEYRDGIGGHVEGDVIHITADAEHSDVVEYGSYKMKPFGTLTHTLETTADDLAKEIDAEIQKRLR